MKTSNSSFPVFGKDSNAPVAAAAYSPANYFKDLIKEHSDMSIPVAAIKALSEIIPLSQGKHVLLC